MDRIPMNRKARLLFLDGRPVAQHVNGEIEWLDELDPESRIQVSKEASSYVRRAKRASNSLHAIQKDVELPM